MEISQIKSQLTLAQVLHHYNLKPDKNLTVKLSVPRRQNPEYASVLQNTYSLLF